MQKFNEIVCHKEIFAGLSFLCSHNHIGKCTKAISKFMILLKFKRKDVYRLDTSTLAKLFWLCMSRLISYKHYQKYHNFLRFV